MVSLFILTIFKLIIVQNNFNKLSLVVLSLLIVFSINTKVCAQTPADDPGIGGPGVGAAPAGDGSPIVPFDTNLSLVLLAAGIYYSTKKLNYKFN